VFEDSTCIAFLDIHPINEGHILVVPKAHDERFSELSENPGHLFAVARILVKAIETSGIKCGGTNLFLSDGKVAGQDVPHVHLHIVPRFVGDGQKAGFVHSETGHYSREQFEQIAIAIRKSIDPKVTNPVFRGIDHSRLFVKDLEASKAWYAKVLGVKPFIDVEGYTEFRVGEAGLSVSPADEKSPFSSGGQVSYWKVRSMNEVIQHFTREGATVYRGPLDIENGEAICQLRDPFGNVIGFVGPKEKSKTGK
jgi:histidine triad (HIT) family protein